ncbi:MAG: serine hydrolase domain-containing protein [Bacteroidales bacterium]
MILNKKLIRNFIKVTLCLAFFLWESNIGTPSHLFSFLEAGGTEIPGGGNDAPVPVSWKIRNIESDFSEAQVLTSSMENMLKRYHLNGASVAVAVEGRLVYAHGVGYADREKGEEVTPGHLFRIASVSKLITAVAIMKMVEEGTIRLDDKVFGTNGLLNDSAYLKYRDKRLERISVRQLLNHTSGFGRRYGDPVFNTLQVAQVTGVKPPLNTDALIRFSLSYPLSYTPGTRYSYSNLGYIILGKVIEKLSGMDYEEYVQQRILFPIGIYDMHIGKSFPYEHLWNEVSYYEPPRYGYCLAIDGSGQSVQRCNGGIDISLLGAAGGWIASSPEMMKFLLAIDGYPESPDILSAASIKEMTTPSSAFNSLLGWRGRDDEDNWWRTGTMAGTVAHVMRRNDNSNWVVFINSSASRHAGIHTAIESTMNFALDSITQWPGIDLLDRTPLKPLRHISAQPIL